MEQNESASVGTNCKDFFSFHWKGLLVVLIPLVFMPILTLGTTDDMRCLVLVCVMAFYWITEVIPLYVTSMLPIVFMPLLGILDSDVVCIQYFKDPLVMFLGGLIVALSIEYCNLHKRLALRVIMLVGCSPRRLHFGLLFVSMFISMWISNSATTAMMCPIIRAILEELQAQNIINIYAEKKNDDEEPHPSRIALAYYLGMAYATTIGGCGTLIGTATNLTFKGIYESRFPDATEKMDFPVFMAYAVPLVWIDTVILFLCMQFTHMGLFRPNSKEAIEVKSGTEGSDLVKDVIKQKYEELGPISMHEFQVIILFMLMVVLLFTRHPGFLPGWADFLNAKPIRSSAPVMLVVVLLFCVPIKYSFFQFCCGRGPFPTKQIPSLLAWKFCHDNIPWGLLFLLGGGYALAEGSTASGMAKTLGNALHGMAVFPDPFIQFLSICVCVFMTAFSSNVAICNIIVPILAELAVVTKLSPLYLIFPAGLACSMAFHLPVSTPPNAIVSGYAGIKTSSMALAGILPTFFTILLLLLNGQTWHFYIYPDHGFPDWALPPNTTTTE